MKLDYTVEIDDVEYVARVTSYYPGDPGRTSGPPEMCYPPEPPEIEWELWTVDDKPAPDEVLTSQREDEITDQLLEWLQEEQDDDYDARYDD